MARDLPPRRPTMAHELFDPLQGSVGRPVSLWNIARSSSSSASPIVAIKQDAPCAPAIAREHVAEQRRVGQRAAHRHRGDGLAVHAASPAVEVARYSAKVGVSRRWRLMPKRTKFRATEFAKRVSCSLSTISPRSTAA